MTLPTFRPLGDRILVAPEVPPDQTASGLWLAEHKKPEQTGTVIAVGPCPHPRKAEAEEIAAEMRRRGAPHWAEFLESLVAREPSLKPGDQVVFSWQVGQEMWINDEARYFLMRESDVLAVIEPDHA